MQIEATLKPLEFGQPHPFKNGDSGYAGQMLSRQIHFGVMEKYVAYLDGDEPFSVLGAPCKVTPIGGGSLKCIITIDEEVVFMRERYGRETYNNLVKKAVAELTKLIDQP